MQVVTLIISLVGFIYTSIEFFQKQQARQIERQKRRNPKVKPNPHAHEDAWSAIGVITFVAGFIGYHWVLPRDHAYVGTVVEGIGIVFMLVGSAVGTSTKP